MKHSKRFKEVAKAVETDKHYPLTEAIALAKTNATAKFDETIEICMNLGIDPKQSDQQIRPTVVLPHGTGKNVRVAAFVDSANETAAKEAGADIIGTEEVIDKIVKKGIIDFDVAVAVPTMMVKLAKAARVLGPRGLMPNPKTDTVGMDIAKMVKEQKGGKVSFKLDNTSNIHLIVGKASFEEKQLMENTSVVVEAIKKAKPAAAKGIYIKSATITSSMGPAVRIDTSTL
ncbi:50S ribosomal protein L1 [Candidatus Uhrbacteria bacterium]|jgi:large subunit ribosomal protein L1|nr:50S ribosomal protein L1 [Candidatus Uhrbacteria bacterium]